ncbi:MAG TPA: thioredoxin family protein [Sandaracinaceae bacterium LLY-WYZ-13_1]|nr:thioredoxin family protein [Sandaracinaceae bacterium LLY-WYZ-13_1]
MRVDLRTTGIASLLVAVLAGCGSEGAADGQERSEAAPIEATQASEPEIEPPPPGDDRGPPPEIARPYDEDADARAQIDAAIASAREDGKRVLLMFGANWCPWCRRLDWVLSNEPRVSAALAQGYHLVHVDVGARDSDTNRDVAARYGDPLSHGLPCLVVLDAGGDVIHVQETGSLEDGDRHDPARVLTFLERHRTDA